MVLYLTKIYPRIIDEYFADQWFFKPTGDGLLLVRSFEEDELSGLVSKTIGDCFQIVDSFPDLCEREPMVNFRTPTEVGIGLAQGAASRLLATDPNDPDRELTLDYSGRVLNLASRLMELARPRGVVVDSGFGAGLIPDNVRGRLKSEEGYVRGVSPEDAVKVYFDPDLTRLPASFKQKPNELDWNSEVRSFTLKEIEEHLNPHHFRLAHNPAEGTVSCVVTHSALSPSKRRISGLQTNFDYPHQQFRDGNVDVVAVDFPSLAKLLREKGLKGPWPVSVRVQYAV